VVSLLGDVWFCVSALGFLCSGALLLYLLGQYRAAVEEAEENDAASMSPESTSEGEPLPIKPVAVSLPPAPVVALPEPRRGDSNNSGGVSPAVVYLQNIKSKMETFEKEISTLTALSAQQAAQGELLLKRLSELAEDRKADSLPRRATPAPAPRTAPKEPLVSKIAEPPPAKAAESPVTPNVLPDDRPASAAAAALKPSAVPSVPQEAEAVASEALPQTPGTSVPEPAVSEPEPVEPSKPRKGPVWPV